MRACLQTGIMHERTGQCYKIYTADGRGGGGRSAPGKAPTKLDFAQRIATHLNASESQFAKQLTAKTVVAKWAVRVCNVSACAIWLNRVQYG